MDAVVEGAAGLLSGFVQGNTPAETALGLLLFGFMYLLAWADGFAKGAAQAESELSALGVMFIMVWSLASTWFMVLMLAVVLFIVDKVLAATLGKGMLHASEWGDVRHTAAAVPLAVPLAVRIAFSWLLNVKLLVALGVAMGLTLGFALVYIWWMRLRRADAAVRQQVVRDIFVFNLVTTIAMVAGQLWIDAWWAGPAAAA